MSGDAVQVLVNGKAVDCVPTLDRGLLYGDGLFETIAVSGGKLCFWEPHMQRLQAGCERLGMALVDAAQLAQECSLLIQESQQAVIKIIITRGSGGRGYRLPEQPHSTRIIQLHDWPAWPADCTECGINTRICSTLLGHNSSLAGIKHLNRLEQVMAIRGFIMQFPISPLWRVGEMYSFTSAALGVYGTSRRRFQRLSAGVSRVGIPAFGR